MLRRSEVLACRALPPPRKIAAMILRWLGLGRPPPAPLDEALWRRALQRAGLHRLPPARREALRERCQRFLASKTFHGAGGFAITPSRQMLLAVLCCRPVLALPADWLDGWHDVIVYPGRFRVRRRDHDENDGVVHEWEEELAGEAWAPGPLVLSWADVLADRRWPEPGFDVVVHEIAHKLDALDGAMNGTPILPDRRRLAAWVDAFQSAFDDLNRRLDRGEEAPIDPYAAEAPEEFFAVASEYHFTAPEALRAAYPQVAAQLEAFYGPPDGAG
ncbi:MAG: hypothetical protein KatS3mg126_0594 [Lysobacteraceae bacterium]|nr:MAG: hypothetical protein KatS3mg126_0594 [Xanthomonadaceae bacterium]